MSSFCRPQAETVTIYIYVYLQISIIMYFVSKINSKSFGRITERAGVAQNVFTNVTDFRSHDDNVRLLPPVRNSKRKGKNIL